MRYLLVGNYGAGNLGDEALKEYFLTAFPEVEWKVVSANPSGEELPRLPGGLRSFVGGQWWKTLRELSRADGMVFGGGSLFTDSESVRACVLWGIHAFAAWCLGRPTYLAFQGVGPFRTAMGEAIARWVFDHAVFVSVRDTVSADRVREWGLRADVFESFDPVFLLLEGTGIPRGGQNLVVIPRSNCGEDFWACARKRAGEKVWSSISILSLQPADPLELRTCAEHVCLLGKEAHTIPVRSISDLLREVGKGFLVLSQRYHGVLAAIALGRAVEIIPQVEGDKLWALKEVQRSGVSHEGLCQRVREGEEALREALLRVPSS